jgi:hypothetical protein
VPVDNLYYQPNGTVRAASHLSLDLQFATDKTLTARVGPTPTFTRGSGATYIGSDGLIHGVDTSTTSNTISAASKTFVLDATAGQDQFWRTGDAVEASNGSNIMAGTVTSYDPATQSLVCNMTTASGTGTFTSWRIGYRGPRFDHDPVTLACRGLLIEEGRTNLFSSTNLNDWLTVRVTKTAITGIGLTNQATTLTIFDTGSTYIYRGATLTTGVAYAISVRVKAGTAPSCSFGVFEDVKFSRNFNLSTNQWAASGGSAEFTNYTVTPNIDGWFLVSAIYTPTGATGLKSIGFIISGTLTETASFDTPQIEAGAFPTSYIPTTTGTLARSADVCSVTTAGWSNAGNDTMVAEYFVRNFLSGSIVLEGGPLVSWMSVSFTGVNQQRNIYRHGGTSNRVDANSDANSVSLTSINKIALTSGEQIALNGSLSQTLFGDPTQSDISTILNIGRRSDFGGANYLNGHIASIRYYRKRLPDAKLQALTV